MDGMEVLPPLPVTPRIPIDSMPSKAASISCTVTGDGSIPVVLVHGFAESGSIWRQTAEGLSDICRTAVPDLPGCGMSSQVSGDGLPTSLEDMADGLARMLDDIGMNACTIVGHSMGGYIALAFAERYPNRLSGLVLFHSTAMPDSQAKREQRQRSIGFMEKHGVEPFLREAIPSLYSPDFQALHPDVVADHLGETLRWATPTLLIGQYRAMMARPDRMHIFQDSRRPSMLIAGALDKAIPLEESLRHGPPPPNDSLLVWDDIAHMGMRECPQRSLTCLRDFLSRTKKI
jgi:pimeloyl-ACP methyl ester carboxylesterase